MQKDNYFHIQITLTIVELKKLNKVVQVTNPRKDPQQGSRRRREKKKHHKLRINCHSDEQQKRSHGEWSKELIRKHRIDRATKTAPRFHFQIVHCRTITRLYLSIASTMNIFLLPNKTLFLYIYIITEFFPVIIFPVIISMHRSA